MKVLQVYKDFYPPVVGGIEGHINVLSRGLKERGIDVEVLVSNTSAKHERCVIDGITICKAPELGRFASAPINITFPKFLKKLSETADILHFHLPNPTATVAYLLGGINKPIVVTYHSDIVKQVRLEKLYRPFQKAFLDKVNAIIATSPNYIDTSNVLKRYAFKCKMIPLGIELAKYSECDSELCKKILQEHKCPFILFIGKFRYYKGLHILIEAMKGVRAKLLIVGDGPLKDTLIKKVKSDNLSDKVVFLGELKDAELNIFLNSCSLLVLPSIFRSEAFGIVLIEAMACGKPVISTELGTGTSFVNIDRKTGIVVPPNDPFKLTEAINLLIEKTDINQRFGKNAKERAVSCFSSEKMVDKIVGLYQSILDGRQDVRTADPGVKTCSTRIKILRIISRLNIGGPSVHVMLLSKMMNHDRYETKLITGSISPHEGDMRYLLQKNERICTIQELQREIHPLKDIISFVKILYLIVSEKPQIIHTHTAKAGTIGRLAAICCNLLWDNRSRIIHTFHGHVLEGYFSPTKSSFFKLIEKIMAHFSDAVIAISNSQQWELTRKYRIAPFDKVHVINLGFDLSSFLNSSESRGLCRQRLGVSKETLLVGIIGRLVPIKNHHLFLKTARIFLDRNPDLPVKFLIVGDGELKTELEAHAEGLGIREKVIFLGWEKDIPKVYADLDILALTSANEGTPVSIIEAMAASVPVVTTGVGGIRDLLGTFESVGNNGFTVCERGILCPKDDPLTFARALEFIVKDEPSKHSERTSNARNYVSQYYCQERLIQNMEDLYETLLAQKSCSLCA